uniref:Ig-like domain-containing protein n=1 Tax=Hippocampus comes TaxID=109280 RepID=A0A3Q2XQH5_HIPCM
MSNPKRMMTMKTRTAAVTVMVALLWDLVIGDVSDVLCRWNTSCLLEGKFSIGDDVVIHWIQLPQISVHSFYHEADRLQTQDKRFKGRTLLFKENIGKGNASLLLKDVVVGDEGRYKCYVGTLMGTSESFVNLHVEAPVTRIHFHCDGRQLICSSDRIFPAPELRWSTEPALPHALINTSEVRQETQTELYNISGSLDLAGDALPGVEYVCDVSSSSSGNRVTWKKTIVNISNVETSIECASVSDQTSLVWTFNSTDIIASKRAGHKLDIAEHWKKHVKGLSEAGSLDLRALTDRQSGTYTCTLSNATRTRVHDVFLSLTATEHGKPKVAGVVIVVIVLLVVGAVAVAVAIYLLKNKNFASLSLSENKEGNEAEASNQLSSLSAQKRNEERVIEQGLLQTPAGETWIGCQSVSAMSLKNKQAFTPDVRLRLDAELESNPVDFWREKWGPSS